MLRDSLSAAESFAILMSINTRRSFVPHVALLPAADDVAEDMDWDHARDAPALQSIMARRRSIRRLGAGPFPIATRERLLAAIRLTPAAYNLPPWRVVLVHERRDELWAEVAAGFREGLSGDRLERYLDRLDGFRGGVAVALIFEDRAVERALREEKGAAPEVAQTFVQQAMGMVQLALWLAITAEGLVTSLQHWDDLIGARAARFAGLDDGESWIGGHDADRLCRRGAAGDRTRPGGADLCSRSGRQGRPPRTCVVAMTCCGSAANSVSS